MRVFVTGASGWIGSEVVRRLIAGGHDVMGLARSERSAQAVAALGAAPHRGDLEDLDSLRAGAAASEGVVHLAYDHDFSQMEKAAAKDRQAIEAMGATLESTGHPFLIASGVAGLAQGRVATERDEPVPGAHPRSAGVDAALALTDRGVRTAVVRFAPTVHGAGDHGFIGTLVGIARDKGVSAYIGDGANRWPAVHRDDAAALVRLALESAPPRTVVHATAEEGVATKAIAEAIGRAVGLPVASVTPDEATGHFGWMGRIFALDLAASSAATQDLLGWRPQGPGLIADIDAGHYDGHPPE